MNMKILSSLDIFKFLMALIVVGIHTEIFYYFPPIDHWYEIIQNYAVPEFFIISSFLFFRKINKGNTPHQLLYKFCKRISILYVFWFIVTAPITFLRKDYLTNGIYGVVHLIKDLFLGSTFHGSCFFSALVFGIIISYYLHKQFNRNNLWIVVIVACILNNLLSMQQLLPESVKSILDIYNNNIESLRLSVWASVYYILLGTLFADEELMNKLHNISKAYLVLVVLTTYTIAGIIGLPLGWIFMNVSIPILFILVLNTKVVSKDFYVMLRKSSIIIFVTHFIYIVVFRKALPDYDWLQHGHYLFLIVILLSSITSYVLLKLSNYKYFKWLKYSY